jgi:hypothetical protein
LNQMQKTMKSLAVPQAAQKLASILRELVNESRKETSID